jgi:hypothetical protein
MFKAHAAIGLAVLSIVATAACGSAPGDEASEASSEALAVPLPPPNTGCVFVYTDWATATSPGCASTVPKATTECIAEWAAIAAQLEANCQSPGEAAFSYQGAQPTGTYYAWCLSGFTPPAETSVHLDDIALGDCRPPGGLNRNENMYTELVTWTLPTGGSVGGMCALKACQM